MLFVFVFFVFCFACLVLANCLIYLCVGFQYINLCMCFYVCKNHMCVSCLIYLV